MIAIALSLCHTIISNSNVIEWNQLSLMDSILHNHSSDAILIIYPSERYNIHVTNGLKSDIVQAHTGSQNQCRLKSVHDTL